MNLGIYLEKRQLIFTLIVIIGTVLLTSVIAYVILSNSKEYTIEYKEYPAALVIATDKEVYSQGTPITVTVTTATFFNGIEINRARPGPTSRYEIIIFDKQGELVSLTDKGQSEATSVSGFIDVLGPHEIDQESFQIDPLFDLNKSGEYTVIMKRRVGVENEEGHRMIVEVSSNPATFVRLP